MWWSAQCQSNWVVVDTSTSSYLIDDVEVYQVLQAVPLLVAPIVQMLCALLMIPFLLLMSPIGIPIWSGHLTEFMLH